MYPILFEFGPITVFSLWFFVACGFVAGSMVFVHFAKRMRVRLNLLADNSFALFFWTLGMSRLAFVMLHPEFFFYRFNLKSVGALFAVWDKGLSFWGALFAFLIGVFYLSKKYEQSPLKLLDILAPAVFIGMFFGNIGAFLDGINYGMPTNLPWGMTFRSANVKYISAIHPTQLYSAFYALGLGLVLATLLKRWRAAGINLSGFIAELGFTAYSLLKFLEEFFRGDETLKLFSIRIPQLMAFFGICAGGYLLYQRYTNRTGGDPARVLKTTLTQIFSRLRKKQDSAETPGTSHLLQNQTL